MIIESYKKICQGAEFCTIPPLGELGASSPDDGQPDSYAPRSDDSDEMQINKTLSLVSVESIVPSVASRTAMPENLVKDPRLVNAFITVVPPPF